MSDALVSRNPATGESVGEVATFDPDAVPAAVDHARAAQRDWGALPIDERLAVLRKASAVFERESERLARLISREMGKPLRDARSEVAGVADMTDELAEMAAALAPETVERGKTRSTIYRDPLGVVAAITPWNFPLLMPHWMVLPALMAGNAVLLKPSEETPLTGQAYVDLLQPLLPPGLITALHGDESVGKALVAAKVDLVAFTGSRSAGKDILRQASDGLKRVILELGGKDPLIVLEGANLTRAARFAVQNSFRNAGQVCVSTERIYAEASIADELLERMVEEASRFEVGDPSEASTKLGPMVSAWQREHVSAQVDAAITDGARVVFRGSAPDGPCWLAPTVLAEVTEEMAIMREETFGPVACLRVVADADEAIEAANDSPYGLGASVWGPAERAEEVARRLSSGMIGVNRGCGGAFGTPWVGARESGYGYHSSPEGHRQFAQTRVVTQRI